MPLAASVLLAATALTIVGLGAGFVAIVTLLLRISSALAKASTHLGMVPEQLEPLDSDVAKLTGSLAAIRKQIDR